MRCFDQQHLLLLGVNRQLAQRALRWQRIVHADADLGCARTVVSADLRAFGALTSNSRVCFRRAIFCLRSRLNLDLSPFREDI